MRVKIGTIALAMFASVAAPAAADTDWNEERIEGKKFDRKIVSSGYIIQNSEINSALQKIANDLHSHYPTTCPAPVVRVVKEPKINAFTFRGSFMYINSGLLDFTVHRDEVAAVIAHELAHSCKLHVKRKIETERDLAIASQIALTVIGGVLQGVAAKAEVPELGVAAGDLSAVAVRALVNIELQGYAERLELEADEVAFSLLESAGYDTIHFEHFLRRLDNFTLELNIEAKHYGSALINKAPGLNARIGHWTKLRNGARP